MILLLRSFEDGQYDNAHARGVAALVVAGFLSGLAVMSVFMAMTLRSSALSRTPVMPYFASLLGANFLQAIGVILNIKWAMDHSVEEGMVCSLQGGIKQAGNVGTAVWSSVISVCVFRLMFLRFSSSTLFTYLVFGIGWVIIAMIVAIGPLVIQTQDKGPYFGRSGYWCWITDAYPAEQTFLEYFFEFVSAAVSFFLYVGILLRVRGNLVHGTDGWHLRFVPSSERWQLAINRDWADSSVMGLAALLIWYPVTYCILLVPISIARFIQFGGGSIPFAVTIFTDTLFNLQGLANAVLLFGTRKLIPYSTTLITAAPRKVIDISSSEVVGITPFVLSAHPSEDRRLSVAPSLSSIDSRTPVHRMASDLA